MALLANCHSPGELMHIRVVQRPPLSQIDGLPLNHLRVGRDYDVGNTLGSLCLAEGWAGPVVAERSAGGVKAERDSHPPGQSPFDPQCRRMR